MRIAIMSSLMVLAALGCGADGSRSGQPTRSDAGSGGAGGGGSTLTGGGDDTSLATGTGGGGVGGGVPGCSAAAQLVYVLSDANELYSFSPDLKKFKLIGTLGC